MTDVPPRKVSVGARVDDHCRPCKMIRQHAVMAAADGVPLRVVCDYCGSQHNYRGARSPREARHVVPRSAEPTAMPLVSERERSSPPMSVENNQASDDLESMLRRVIREECGMTPVALADRWRGGEIVLRPGREGLQEKTIPIETFFSKVVMVRNRLRTLEQQVNASDLASDVKVKIQSYLTGCYGSLTSLNVLFADDDDRFHGSGK
jgi:hypothetical protein